MHYWGDEWFKKHGNELYAAIEWISKEMHRCHIDFMNKEKYGCNDVEHLHFWDGSIYSLLFGYRCYIRTTRNYKWEWLERAANKFHHWLYYKFDWGYDENLFWGIGWKGMAHYITFLGITDIVQKWQVRQYNRIYQKACKKWPHLVDELISDDCYGYELIKPCKYGNIDGTVIHDKYWKKLN